MTEGALEAISKFKRDYSKPIYSPMWTLPIQNWSVLCQIDAAVLSSLFRYKEIPPRRLARWSLFLQGYFDFEIEHRKGSEKYRKMKFQKLFECILDVNLNTELLREFRNSLPDIRECRRESLYIRELPMAGNFPKTVFRVTRKYYWPIIGVFKLEILLVNGETCKCINVEHAFQIHLNKKSFQKYNNQKYLSTNLPTNNHHIPTMMMLFSDDGDK
ncbi:hypothetical protein CVS40_10613 [Lucilia cuprina]|nr:hypothetical protein CVS40_10613 [Lucilia cuprina]